MKRIATAIAAAALALSAAHPALSQDYRHAGDRHHRPHADRYEPHRERHSGRDAAIIGGLGLAAGILIGSIVVDRPAPPPPRWDGTPPRRPGWDNGPRWDDRPRWEYGPRFARPWTPGWYRWCSENRRYFDPRSGTFVGRDGRRHFCEAG